MLIDISQEVFSSRTFPGDPQPEQRFLMETAKGEVCNLTAFSMCAHNGTHIDAPFHFLQDGRTVDQMVLFPFVGACYVAWHEGELTASDAKRILDRTCSEGAGKRILVGGDMIVTPDAARVFASAELLLFGNESQTVGPPDAPREVHLIMLGAQIVLLEGIVLKGVPEGVYFLNAAPLNLGGCDGAPCRAFLMDRVE